MAITTNVQKSFIKAIAPVFSALFMKKKRKNPEKSSNEFSLGKF